MPDDRSDARPGAGVPKRRRRGGSPRPAPPAVAGRADGRGRAGRARAGPGRARRRRGPSARQRPRRSAVPGPGSGRRLRGYSGPGPDPRDPQPFGAVLAKLVKARGWQQPAAEGRVFGMWPGLVGADLAAALPPGQARGRRADHRGGVDRLGDPAAAASRAAARPVRHRGGQGFVGEAHHPRAGQPVVAQGAQAGTRPRPPRHLRLSRSLAPRRLSTRRLTWRSGRCALGRPGPAPERALRSPRDSRSDEVAQNSA